METSPYAQTYAHWRATRARPRLKTVRLGLRGSVAVTGSVQVTMRSNFDIKWFQIAVTHERAAIEARERAAAAPDGSKENG